MYADDKCFQCGAAIVPRYGYVPMCQPCARAYLIECEQRDAWKRKLSSMGAMPGKRTHRHARLRAAHALNDRVKNDNGLKFGDERARKRKRP